MKKSILTTCLIFSSLCQSLSAHDFVVDGIYYTYLSQTYQTVSVSYRGSSYYEYSNEFSGNVVIPASVTYHGTTYSVTSIGNDAFHGCTGLTSVEIPSRVTSIGSSAFSGCTELTSVSIPSRVTSIGSSVFYGCSGLTSIEIPSSVTSIGEYAFYNCSSLTSIEIPSSVTSIGERAFNNCRGLTSVEIPSSVTSIGEFAFHGCSGLTRVEITSVESICRISFGNTYANPLSYAHHLYIGDKEITEIVIPSSVTGIGECAFSGCSGLTSIEIPSSVTSIGECAFYDCI